MEATALGVVVLEASMGQLEAATLNDRLLADIGIDRGALLSASTEYEFMAQNEVFVPRHDLG